MEPLRSGDPRRISSYEILNRLGAGGMGQVYLGRSPSGRRVAVKVIRPELTNDPTFRQRFRREVTAMRQVSGFFTAPVVDADPDGDPAWLATAFVPGPSLESAVADGGPMSHQDVLLLAAGLAEALNAIHREGLTHRDLKPGNVLMAEDGPRVIDFGLAITAESTGLTQAGTVVGTPAFMSPEQVSGQQVGPASDVWSLGAVLAYAATAASPFGDGSTMDTMLRVMNGEPDLSGLTGTLAQLVTACMMKDPYARPTPARILQVLSEGAGVQATMAMEIQLPVATDTAQAGGGAGGAGSRATDTPAGGSGVADQAGTPSVVAPSVVTPSVSAPAVAEPEVAAPSVEAPQVQLAQPAWPTESAAQAASSQAASSHAASSQPPTPAPAWGTAQTAGPAPDPKPAPPAWGSGQASTPPPVSTPPAPAWGSAQVSGPVQGSNPVAPPVQPTPSQPATPAPAWGSQASAPTPPSTPPAQAWGSGQASSPAPVPPSQPPAPAWGSGAVNPAPQTPAWGAPPPGPMAGPSTPAQPMPSMPPNQWPQSGQGSSPMYPNQGVQSPGPWAQQQYGMPMQQQMPVKKNRTGLIVAAGVGAVVVIGGIIAIVLSSGSGSSSNGTSGGTTGGTTAGTLGGTGGIGPVTPIAATFPLKTLVTDADAAQYLKATPTASAPTDDTTDDPTTFDKDWLVDTSSAELRVQASNYKSSSPQAVTDFGTHISTLETDAKFEDQGALGNSDKTEIQVATDQSSGLQHCKIEILRGGLDVTVTLVESGSSATGHTDAVNLAKLITGRLPAK